jgi:Dna[CI] antecedent, DciA
MNRDRPSEAERTAELKRLTRWKSTRAYTPHVLGEDAIELFNKEIKKRHSKFGKLAEAWDVLVPALFQSHTYLATFARGTLTVHVDSSAHLYELKQLMLAGLEDQLLLACRGEGLKKVALKRGRADPTSMTREPD